MSVAEDVVQRVQGRLGSTVAGRWRLSRVLGIGGMAVVYAAVHRNQNRVALKMLHPEQSLNETVRSRFLREGYVANTVNHPGAVRVHDDGVTDDGAAFLVMELLEGESLEDRRDRLGGRLPVAEVLALIDQLLDTLAAAHQKGIVHRDIKPDNLFLTRDGELKVLDFGIAQLRELSDAAGGTSAGTFMGTPSFMSPEQARGRWNEVDARSDLWATGATMFYLLSSHFVHEAESFADQLALSAREPAPPLQSVAPEVPASVGLIVDKALAYQPHARFQDAASMQVAVRAALREVGPPKTLSIRVDEEKSEPARMDTLLATPDRAPQPSDKGTPVGVVTPARETGASGRGIQRRIAVVAGVAGLIVLAAILLRRGPEPVAEPAAEPASRIESSTAATAEAAPAAPPAEPRAEGRPAPAPVRTAPALVAPATPTGTARPLERRPRPSARSGSSASPPVSATAVPSQSMPPAATPQRGILDRRF